MFCFNVFAYLYYPKPLWKWRKIHHIRNRQPANSKKGQHDWTSCRDSGVFQKAVILLPSTGIKKIPHGNLRESLHIEGYAYLLWSSAAVGARKNSAVPLRLHLRINKMVHRRQGAYKKLSKCTFTNESQYTLLILGAKDVWGIFPCFDRRSRLQISCIIGLYSSNPELAGK